MAKAKKIDEKSLIHFNLEKLEAKVNEFQDYLEMNSINSIVTKDGEVELSLDAQDQLHKEILVQIKMQDALFSWMPILEKLKEGENNKTNIDTYGDKEINGLFKDQMND
jgi:hypothetical protein